MVQIKPSLATFESKFSVLYIPYGSDKTGILNSFGVSDSGTFISHMVQIKPNGTTTFGSSTDLSLYHIWFR